MNITIRKATEQDFETIIALQKAFAVFQKTPEKMEITFEQMKAEQHLFQCFVAETETKEIIGLATFFYTYYSWTGKAIYLDDLYVTDDYRKHGDGKKLLDAVINLAKETECKKVRWQVSRWNDNAIAFYNSIGAVTDDTEINCDYVINNQ